MEIVRLIYETWDDTLRNKMSYVFVWSNFRMAWHLIKNSYKVTNLPLLYLVLLTSLMAKLSFSNKFKSRFKCLPTPRTLKGEKVSYPFPIDKHDTLFKSSLNPNISWQTPPK